MFRNPNPLRFVYPISGNPSLERDLTAFDQKPTVLKNQKGKLNKKSAAAIGTTPDGIHVNLSIYIQRVKCRI